MNLPDAFIALSIPLLLLMAATRRSLHRGINLGDEGYLVYGTQEVLRGKIPILDFRAYDPLRYYWCAVWVRMIGSEFIAIRLSMVAFSALSVALCSMLVLSTSGNPIAAALSGVLALIWMHPRHKQIEHFFSLVCCCVMYALIAGIGSPFLLGAVGAIGAAFGLNILVYFFGAAVLSFAANWLLRETAGLEGLSDFLIGLVSGMALLLFIAAMTPGFLRRYLDLKVLALLKRGSTNLRLQRPWIWKRCPQQFAHFTPWVQVGLRLLFTLLPAFYLASIVSYPQSTAESPAVQLILAASCTGLAYFHHALSRADLSHIHQIMQPAIVAFAGVSVALFSDHMAVMTLLLAIVASLALLRNTPEFAQTWRSPAASYIPWVVGNDRFLLPKNQLNELKEKQSLVERYTRAKDPIFTAPSSAAFLALFHRRSAVYDTFPIYPANPAGQRRMLEELHDSQPPLAFISKGMVDQREDLQFEKNYPEVFRFFTEQYHLLEESPSGYVFVRQKPPS